MGGCATVYRLSNHTSKQLLSRSPAAEVWKQVEKDLTEAEATTELPTVYPAAELGRATKGAVIALLGKVYLYQEKWGLAQTTFEKLMGAPYAYKLDPSFDNVFS